MYENYVEWDKELPEDDWILCLIFYNDDYHFGFYEKSVDTWDDPDNGWVHAKVEKWKKIANIPKI